MTHKYVAFAVWESGEDFLPFSGITMRSIQDERALIVSHSTVLTLTIVAMDP